MDAKANVAERKTFKAYIPEQAGDLATAVDAAAEQLGRLEKRKITTSDWIILAVTEKLERDAIPPSIRERVPGLTIDRVQQMLVWENPGVGLGVSSDFAAAADQADEIRRRRLCCGQLCSLEVSLSLEDAQWLLAHGARKAPDRNRIHEEALRHAGYLGT